MTDDKSKLLSKLSLRIREERLKKGISSEKLAYEIGISKGNLSEIERGLRDLRFSTLKAVADGLDIPLSKLLKDI